MYIHAYTLHRTSLSILLQTNGTLLVLKDTIVYVWFNESAPAVPARITTKSSITTICPPMPRAGMCSAQVLVGPTLRVFAEFKFKYVLPPVQVSLIKVPMSGAELTLKV
jgi:hypothetical protein